MSIEDLMKPRYKVIADWPDNNFWMIGDVLIFEKCKHGYYYEHWYLSQKSVWYEDYSPLPKQSFKTYPHLFKKLEWWEERSIEDMPEYVQDDNGIYKVREWHFDLATKVTVFINPKIYKGYIDECTECPLYSDFLPATEQDYNNYINKTK